LSESRLVEGDLLFEGFGGVAGEREMRPGVAAEVHAGCGPDVEGLLGVGVVLELEGVDEAVDAL
jgi:hypothetical protein